jgi:hypothetical protein
MMRMNKNKKGQAGFVITVELLLIVVILVMGLVTGWAKVRDQSLAELGDTGDAIGAIDQSYQVMGTRWLTAIGIMAAHTPFGFTDAVDTAATTAIGGDGATQEYNTNLTAAVTGSGGTFEASTF